MKVIFLKDVAKVGQRGTMKEVADGYALNFLIARGFAVQATPEKIAAHLAAEKKADELREKEEELMRANVKSLSGEKIEMRARATEKGGLFKSVTAQDIAHALGTLKGIHIPPDAIELDKPFKQTGEHPVIIKTVGATAEIIVAIVAN